MPGALTNSSRGPASQTDTRRRALWDVAGETPVERRQELHRCRTRAFGNVTRAALQTAELAAGQVQRLRLADQLDVVAVGVEQIDRVTEGVWLDALVSDANGGEVVGPGGEHI